jgi:hypothetical protein
MYRIFPDFQYWEFFGNTSAGLMIECKRKPTKRQLEALFDGVEEILPHYPVLDLSDTISYEDYIAFIESKDSDWFAGDGYDFIKSHQKHCERSFLELWKKTEKEMAE